MVRDVQRILNSIIEDPTDNNTGSYKILDDLFAFKALAEFMSKGPNDQM